MNIHPTAVVEEGATLADDVEVGPHAVIYRGVTVGPGCKIHAGAILGGLPQDLAYKDSESYVRIGARVVIREHVTINRGTKPGSETVVGDDCFLMAGAHLAHNVRIGQRVILANGVLLAGYVEVGDRVFLGGNSAVHQFCRVGRLAMMSGCAALSKDLPPFCVMGGCSLNRVRGVNIVGMKRAGMSPEERTLVRRAFRTMFRAGLNVKQALQQLDVEFTDGPVREFCDFIRASKRGIAMASGQDDTDE